MGFALGGFGRAGYNTPGSFTNVQVTTDPVTSAQTRTTQIADTRQEQLFGRYTLGWDYDLDSHNSLAASLAYGTRNATTYQDALATTTAVAGLSSAMSRAGRQISAMATHLQEKMREAGAGRVRVEGAGGSDWVLIDVGDIVVHLFKPDARQLYALEKMWGEELDEQAEDSVG